MQRLGFFILMCLITTVSWAQKISVSGIVFDESGPLPGASVVVKGSETNQLIGTVTDLDGNFTLNVAPNSVLVVSFMGYQVKEISLKGETSLKIQLESETTELDQVLVVGYGVQKKASSVASISQAKGEELLKVGSVTTISEALQGMLPGVTSVASNGMPGSDANEIFIRGKASWQGSDPLVLVDGVERDMNDVDPNEIDNISVLKDASATAVFGVKGGNGVILITTKRGAVSKPEISFSANFGVKMPTEQPEYGNYVTAMELWNEALKNDNQWSDLIPESTIDAWRNAYAMGLVSPNSDYFPEVDWWNKMVKDFGYQQQYNMNVSGGSDFLKYFVSLGYLNDDDIFKTDANEIFDPSFNYKRYNWRSNFDLNLSPTTELSVNIAGNLGYRNQAGYRINDAGSSAINDWGQEQFFKQLYTADRNSFPIMWSDGTYGAADDGTGNIFIAFDYGQRKYKYFDGFYDFKLNQKLDFITKGLSTKLSVSYSNSSSYYSDIQRFEGGNFGEGNYVRYSREYDYANPNPDGTYSVISETRWPSGTYQTTPPTASYDNLMKNGYDRKMYYELALNYNRSFGNHNVSALALFSRREKTISLGRNSDGDYPIDIPFRQEDWVGRVTYNYKERYLAEFNGSYNGSESFAPGKRFGFFPSATVGYRLSEEPFIKERFGRTLTNLKLRYSMGTAGFDPKERFTYIQKYTSSGSVKFGETTSTSYGPLYYEKDPANVNATWETSYKQNFGAEFILIEKLTGSVDVFIERRKDILMDFWSPTWFSVFNATGNVGETKNHGSEIELGWTQNIGPDFRYWIKGNYAWSENRVVKRGDGANALEYEKKAGKPIGYSETYLQTGYYQSLDDIFNYGTASSSTLQSQLAPGDFMFVDYNADGEINSLDQVVISELTYPLKSYGFSLGAEYKGWSLNMVFYGVMDVTKNVPGEILWDNTNGPKGIYSVNTDALDRWTLETSEYATKPALHSISSYSRASSTYTFQDASYLRLKNVELSYRFKKSLLEKFGLSKLQLYTNGNNLITLTNYNSRLDPEARNAAVYPMVKRVNFGLRASF